MNATDARPKGASKLSFTILLVICLFFLALFSSLGIWQVQRLGWKLDLIEQVDKRAHLPPIAAPDSTQWNQLSPDTDDYSRVTIHGSFLNDHEVLVNTITDYGSGYWLMVPLKTDQGDTIFINRGFVPMGKETIDSRRESLINHPVDITGFLRMSEGSGYWPRKNNPEENIWYSRDVYAMAEQQNLGTVAPYFIDSDAVNIEGDIPRGGLTIVTFRNNHLTYALTWFSLAAFVLGATIFVIHSYRKGK